MISAFVQSACSPLFQRERAAERGLRRARRRGYVTLATVMMLVIAIGTLILVVDWSFLVLASRRTLLLSDSLALTAVSELIDEDRLQDLPLDQTQEINNADDIIRAPGGFLDQNNAVLAERLRPLATEVTVYPARVEDANIRASTPGNFTMTLAPGDRANSLVVDIFRDPAGGNPVTLLIRAWGAPDAAKITSSTTVTLDSRVIGYRPRINSPSPVAPIALRRDDWFNLRANQPLNGTTDQFPLVPPGGNGRKEFDFVTKYHTGVDPANKVNCAVINVDASAGVLPSAAVLQAQTLDGIVPGDVDGSGVLGPFHQTGPIQNDLRAENVIASTADLGTIVTGFQTVAASADPRRVFLIYDDASPTLPGYLVITGFVAANVCDAEAEPLGMGGPYRLRLRLEPAAIVHFTSETSFFDVNGFEVLENDYCHKVRLTR